MESNSSLDSGSSYTAGDDMDPSFKGSKENVVSVESALVAGQPIRKGSTFGAFLTIVCIVIGTGSLQLPLTFKQAGWIGILLVIISSIVATFTGSLVIRSLYLMDPSRVRSFNQIGQAAFGLPGRITIYFFHTIYVLGIVCSYIILSGQSFSNIITDSGHKDIGEKPWMCICAVVMWIASISLKQMSEAAILSFFGFTTSIATVIIAVVMCFAHPYRSDGTEPFDHHPAKHEAAIGSGIPIALATISFSFCAVVVMPGVESAMKKPQRWNRVLMGGMSVVTAAYLLVAIAGYWAYGDQTVSPILNNLPNNAAVKAAKVLISLHVIFASPVMATSLFLELELALGWTKEQLGAKREFLLRFIFRTIFFGAMLGIAIVIPYFSDVMALVGAFSTSILLFIIPVLCYIKLRGWRDISWQMWVASVVVVGIGIYACVMGAKDAVEALQETIRNNK